jgi:hypothetical protein
MFNFQFSLFHDFYQIINNSKFHKKYFYLFDSLDLKNFPDRIIFSGRKGYSKHSILKALIVKHIESINSIPSLIRFLDAHPILSEMCGFKNMNLPDPAVFYRFLKNCKNHLLKSIHFNIKKLSIKIILLLIQNLFSLLLKKIILKILTEILYLKIKNQNEIKKLLYLICVMKNFLITKKKYFFFGVIELMLLFLKKVFLF